MVKYLATWFDVREESRNFSSDRSVLHGIKHSLEIKIRKKFILQAIFIMVQVYIFHDQAKSSTVDVILWNITYYWFIFKYSSVLVCSFLVTSLSFQGERIVLHHKLVAPYKYAILFNQSIFTIFIKQTLEVPISTFGFESNCPYKSNMFVSMNALVYICC